MKSISQLFVAAFFAIAFSPASFSQWLPTNGPYGGAVHCLAVNGPNLYAGTGGGVFLSTDNGTSWTNIGEALSGLDVLTLAVTSNGAGNTTLLAGCSNPVTFGGYVFRSTNNGATWIKVLVDSIDRHNGLGSPVYCFAFSPDSSGGTDVFAGTRFSTFLSRDDGTSWTNMGALWPGNVAAFATTPNGAGGTNFLACSGYLYLSTDNGTTWPLAGGTQMSPGNWYFSALAVSNNGAGGMNIFVGTSLPPGESGYSTGGILLSTDYGATWSIVNDGLPTNPVQPDPYQDIPHPYPGINTFAVSGAGVYAGTTSGVFLSTNNGTTWSAASSGLTDTNITALAAIGAHVFAGTKSGVFISSDNGTSWSKAVLDVPASNVAALSAGPDGIGGTTIYAGTPAGVYSSSTIGGGWRAINSGITNLGIGALVANGANVYAGTASGLFLSTNYGTSWSPRDTGLTAGTPGPYITAMAADGKNIFAGGGETILTFDSLVAGRVRRFTVKYAPVYHLADDGMTWSPIAISDRLGCGPSGGGELDALLIDSSKTGSTTLYALTGNLTTSTGGTYRTTDNGAHWACVFVPSDTINPPILGNFQQLGFVSDGKGGTNIVAGGFYWTHPVYGELCSGIYLSTDDGRSWNAVMRSTSLCQIFTSFAANGTNLFAGSNLGVSLSTDCGWTWAPINSGLPDMNVQSLLISDGYLYAGTYGGGVWKIPLWEFPMRVGETEARIPATFRLFQNYPNPFNPSTTIEYQLPVNSHVTLKIYDLLGREVAALVDKNETAGDKSVTFDAGRLSSGVYFYRLDAGAHHDVKKLLLLK
ncbi:MAG TPA: T9SS type A sorting domain-containing protein [Bacteroidota bacterium]|nr:T9SS type A sorting domain-containing protein [Bacteroidota bacterium]